MWSERVELRDLREGVPAVLKGEVDLGNSHSARMTTDNADGAVGGHQVGLENPQVPADDALLANSGPNGLLSHADSKLVAVRGVRVHAAILARWPGTPPHYPSVSNPLRPPILLKGRGNALFQFLPLCLRKGSLSVFVVRGYEGTSHVLARWVPIAVAGAQEHGSFGEVGDTRLVRDLLEV